MTGASLSIHSPGVLQVRDGAARYDGANQNWYPSVWRRMSGCGPTTCSQLLWYLAATRDGCRALCAWDAGERAGMLQLMQRVWGYVTPGMRGVDTPRRFVDGALRYGHACGVPLRSRVLDIPDHVPDRPVIGAIGAFLSASFRDDLPVAFLNRSNGAVRNLENWHWVTLVAWNPQGTLAQMYDQGRRSQIDLQLWLRTAANGGAFVALEQDPQAMESPQGR